MQIIPSIALQVHPLPEQFLVNCFVFIRYVIELQGNSRCLAKSVPYKLVIHVEEIDFAYSSSYSACRNSIRFWISSSGWSTTLFQWRIDKYATLETTAQRIKILTFSSLGNLCKVIIFHYLIPTQQDLIDWQEDPENYINEELRYLGTTRGVHCLSPANASLHFPFRCAWLEKKKACAEVLFCTIARKYSEYVCPIVLQQLLQCLQSTRWHFSPTLSSFLTFSFWIMIQLKRRIAVP